MDALTISGIVGAVTLIAALCLYVFKVFTRETTFEEAYGKNALKLLTEEKLQKAKAKTVKGKKIVSKPSSVKVVQPVVQDKQELEVNVGEVPEREVELPVSKNSSLANSSQFPVQSTSDASPLASVNQSEPLKETSEDSSTKKQKKKNRIKKAEVGLAFSSEDFLAGVQKTEEKVVILTKIEKKIENDIVKPEKPVHVTKLNSENTSAAQSSQKEPSRQEDLADNISMSDVIKRLKSMKNLEPEYADFLFQYNFKESKLQDNIDFLKRQNIEKEKSVEQVNAELKNARNENSKLKTGLKEQYDKYETFEQTVRSKLTEIMQLKDENKRLNVAIAETQQMTGQYQQLVREVEVLRTELTKKSNNDNDELIASKKLTEKLNAEISKICQQNMATKISYENELKKAQGELQRDRDQHTKEYQAAQQQILELTGEMERAFAMYADTNKAQNFQYEQAQNLKLENEKLSSELNSLKAKCQHSEREIEQSNSSISQYKNHINELSLELQEARSSSSMNKENVKTAAELVEKNAKLSKQLDIAQKRVQDFEEWHKKSFADKAKTEELVKKNQELEAEIKALTNQVQCLSAKQNEKANNAVSASGEVLQQLEHQKRKNQELREANYKLLETVQSQEVTTKKLMTGLEIKHESGLKEIVETATKNLKLVLPFQKQIPTLTGDYTIENVGAWLEKITRVLQKQQSVPVSTVLSQRVPSPIPNAKQDSKEELEKLKRSIVHYKSSLQHVKNQLNFVERVAEEVDKEQRAKIAQLEKTIETFGVLKNCAAAIGTCSSPDLTTVHELNNVEVKSSGSEEWEVVGEAGH